MSRTFTVNKANVYTEVAKTSSYTGLKMADDGSAYERVFTTDADRLMLERFWAEAANAVTDLFKPFISSVTTIGVSHGVNLAQNYQLTVDLSSSYDSSLDASVSSSLFSFFVNYIVAQWYKFCDKSEADGYLKDATAMLEDVRAKIYHKKKPTRVAPTD